MDRRSLLLVLIALALAAAIVAAPSAGKPVFVSEGNTRMAFDAGIAPGVLPAERFAAADLMVATRISSLDGSRPKALRRFQFETDTHLLLDLKHVPVCRYAQIKNLETGSDECSGAIVGTGVIYFDTESPRSNPYLDNGAAYLYNGGLVRGNRRLWLRYRSPISSEKIVVDPLEVQRFRSGPYRRLWTLSISRAVVDGASLTGLRLRLNQGISASCPTEHPTRKWRFAATSEFSDGSRLIARTSNRCHPA
jgi:hypothetical protein